MKLGKLAQPQSRSISAIYLIVVSFILTAAGSLLTLPAAAQQEEGGTYRLHVSSNPGRGKSIKLEEKGVVSDKIYAFITPKRGINRVRFFLDLPESSLEDPLLQGSTPLITDAVAPYDFAGTDADGNAKPFDTSQLTEGRHTITAAIELSNGTTEVVSADFIVGKKGVPALHFREEKLEVHLPVGGRTSKAIHLLTSTGGPAQANLSINNSLGNWLSLETPVEALGTSDVGATVAPAMRVINIDASELEPGFYEATIAASAGGFAPASLPVSLVVGSTRKPVTSSAAQAEPIATTAITAAATTCTPLPCSEILVDLPYTLTFNRDHGKIHDGNGVGTGFTYIDWPTNGTGYIPKNLAVNMAAPGTFNITTTSGISFLSNNSQDNTIGVGIDAPSQISVLSTTLLHPPAGSKKSEQAGLWFGNDQDNYVKLVVISGSTGTVIHYLMEVNGAQSASRSSAVLNLTSATVKLKLRVNPNDRTITATYSVNGGSTASLGNFTAPAEFFSFDAAGIDPAIGTRSFGGVFATHRLGPSPLVYSFDNFSVTAETPPPPTTEFGFNSKSFAVPNPTSMVWGPDNKLYVTELFGKIHQITLDSAKNVVSHNIITTLGSRLTLGITVDPSSTASNVILWVAHSNPSTSDGQLNSSTVSRLSGSGFTTKQDRITGLPRAIANHAINSIHFGPDGKLYIAHGGNTGAGAPNTANTEFGTRAEQPLSAALLVADVNAPGFDGTCATPENSYGPSPCSVKVYSSGLRNMYDFVWHSNGFLYGPNNGLGVTGNYPPKPTPPCEGFGDTRLWTDGGDNPGEQPDIFVRLEQGKYYGHPNPYRNQCVFKDGSYQGVAPLANYVAPIHIMGLNTSSNGTIEYKANAFNGALKGQILIANYSVGDNIVRLKLSSDGKSVVEAKHLVGGFNDPLPLVQDPSGTIYVGEFGAGKVTALIPTSTSSDTTPPAKPTGLVAAGSTSGIALGWNVSTETDLAGYHVYRSSSTSGPFSRITSALVNRSSYNDTAAPTGKTSFYRVTAVDTSGNESAQSDVASATRPDSSSSGSWQTKMSAPVAILDAGGAALGGKLYVVAGKTSSGPRRTLYIYNPATNSWTTGPSLPTAYAAVENPAVVAYNGKLYVFGGSTAAFSGAVASAAVFNPGNNTWTMLASMAVARGGATVQLINNKLYVVGGMNGSGASLSSVAVYNPATNLWTTAASMSTRRDNPGSAALGGKLYVFGGRIRNSDGTTTAGTLSTVEMYDPASNSWTARTSMPTGRRAMVVGTIKGRAQVIGGERKPDGTTFAQNEEYDPATNSWQTLSPMLTPRHGAAAGTINNVVYVATGGPTGGSSFSAVTEAFSFPSTASYDILVSKSSSRTSPSSLAGQTVSGNIYVFTSPNTSNITQVRFWLDDLNMTGSPRHVEANAPYDFAGGSATVANPFNTSTVVNGTHTITAAIDLSDGTSKVVSAAFTVAN